MKNVVLWGNTVEYDYYQKYLQAEVLKGNIHILAIIFNEGRIANYLDGIPVIGIEEILYLDYDYIIDMNQRAFEERSRIIELLQIPRYKVVFARIFAQPFFDFARWHAVKESNVSIISSHCWGGFVYNNLNLPFLTPFINMAMSTDSFFKLCSDLQNYISKPLEFMEAKYEPNLQRNYPVMALGDVILHFNHYESVEEAEKLWEKRKARINFSNLFFETLAVTEKDLERFMELPYEHKICFTTIPCQEKNVLYIHEKIGDGQYAGGIGEYVNATATKKFLACKEYDLLKLLNHEPDFRRAEY